MKNKFILKNGGIEYNRQKGGSFFLDSTYHNEIRCEKIGRMFVILAPLEGHKGEYISPEDLIELYDFLSEKDPYNSIVDVLGYYHSYLLMLL